MASRETWVTTLDNPFDPFSDFDNWKRFDEDHGYYTTELICRFLNVSDEFDDDLYNEQVEEAVDKVVHYNFYGNYRKVVK